MLSILTILETRKSPESSYIHAYYYRSSIKHMDRTATSRCNTETNGQAHQFYTLTAVRELDQIDYCRDTEAN